MVECRICCGDSDKFMSLSSSDIEEPDTSDITELGKLFEDCLGLKVCTVPNRTKVCVGCSAQLKLFAGFKRKSKASEKRLLSKWNMSDDKTKRDLQIRKRLQAMKDQISDKNEDFEQLSDFDLTVSNEAEEDSKIQDEVFSHILGENLSSEEIIVHVVEAECIKEELCMSSEDDNVQEENADDSENYLDDPDSYRELSCKVTEMTVEILNKTNTNEITPKVIRKKFECEPCHKKFVSQEMYQAHMNIHEGLSPFSCDTCHRGFKRIQVLKHHIMRHKNLRNYPCNQCDKRFVCRNELKRHLVTHCETKSFCCDICGKQFNQTWHLKMHHDTHLTGQTYECSFCHKFFKNPRSLLIHVKTVHTQKKKYFCTSCDYVAYRTDSLTRHKEAHMRNTNRQHKKKI